MKQYIEHDHYLIAQAERTGFSDPACDAAPVLQAGEYALFARPLPTVAERLRRTVFRRRVGHAEKIANVTAPAALCRRFKRRFGA